MSALSTLIGATSEPVAVPVMSIDMKEVLTIRHSNGKNLFPSEVSTQIQFSIS